MAKNFTDLEAAMPLQAVVQGKAKTKQIMAEMVLAQVRRIGGQTLEETAAALGIEQPTLSRLESQDDMPISTLRRLIEALGGELEIIAHLPGGDIRLTQFKDVA